MNSPGKMTAEQATLFLVTRCNPLDVLVSQIERFRSVHGHAPTICVVHAKCRSGVVRALIQQLDWMPEDAVAEPIFMNGVPVVFQQFSKELFLLCKSSSAQETL